MIFSSSFFLYFQYFLMKKKKRILIFSKKSIDQVKIFIDSKYIGLAQSSIDNSHLFILQWNPNEFNDEFIHQIRVEIQVNFVFFFFEKKIYL